MSHFLNNSIWQTEDRRASDLSAKLPSEYSGRIDVLWDRSGFVMGGTVGLAYGIASAERWEVSPEDDCLGASSSYIIEGIVYIAGTRKMERVSGVTVRAFTASDNQFQGMAVSDASGQFHLGTLRSDAHFLIANKDSPALAGTTDNLVMPEWRKVKVTVRAATTDITLDVTTSTPKNINVRLYQMPTSLPGNNITLGPALPFYDASLVDWEQLSLWKLRPMTVWWNSQWNATAFYVQLDGRRGQVNTTGQDSSIVE